MTARFDRNPNGFRKACTGLDTTVETQRTLGLEASDDLMRAVRNALSWSPKSTQAAVLLVVALLGGACTTPYDGRYDFYSGWRKAQISQISPVDLGVPATPSRCSKSDQNALPPGTAWAVVRYRLGGHTRYASAPTRLQDKFAVGDLVYANVSECMVALERRQAAG